jgi:hypothetical protein
VKRKNLRDQWREISLEKKLAMFVAPVVVAILSGILVPVLTGAFSGGDGAPKRSAKLEVVDLAVGGGTFQRLLSGPPSKLQFVDVTVRNTGDLVSVIKRASFRIQAFGFLRICGAGGGLEPSENYNVTLPPRPKIGDEVAAKVSQQIAPNAVDRFTFRLNVPFRAMQLGTYLYQLDVKLFRDTEPRPLDAGKVLVSIPYTPNRVGYFPPPDGRSGFPECERPNLATFKRVVALEGVRSPNLSEGLLSR